MAYSEDSFPTADAWQSQAENIYKTWPTDKNPLSVTVKQDRPAFTNYSHNGRKFTRRSSFSKWQLEVEYPPLTDSQFTPMHACALAAQGQYNPFSFPVDYLFQYNSNATPNIQIATAAQIGNKTLSVKGLPYNTSRVIRKGEILGIPNLNGDVNIVAVDTDSNAAGLATVSLTYPIQTPLAVDDVIKGKLEKVTVTLAENGFEYDVTTDGFYIVTVTFDLDEFK